MLAALRARAFVAECVGPLELNAAVQCCCATVRSKQAPLSARALRLAIRALRLAIRALRLAIRALILAIRVPRMAMRVPILWVLVLANDASNHEIIVQRAAPASGRSKRRSSLDELRSAYTERTSSSAACAREFKDLGNSAYQRGNIRATSAPGLGSPHPTSAPGLGSPRPKPPGTSRVALTDLTIDFAIGERTGEWCGSQASTSKRALSTPKRSL